MGTEEGMETGIETGPETGAATAADSGFEIVNAVLSAEPISVGQAIAAVESDTAGAVVSFSGVVRNHDGGKPVERLSYSAHPVAHQVMADVVAQLVAEHAGDAVGAAPVRIWAAHRVGMLEIGDPALVCAVSASHRGQAFEVCSELVDRIKAQVPIWKEQFFSDGSVEWVGAGD
jgi:molybdopterin synthase catalytic subunit